MTQQVGSNESWKDAKLRFPIGTLATGVVCKQTSFGVFVDLGMPFWGLLEVFDMQLLDAPKKIRMEDFPGVGERVDTVVIGHNDRSHQIHLKIIRPPFIGKNATSESD